MRKSKTYIVAMSMVNGSSVTTQVNACNMRDAVAVFRMRNMYPYMTAVIAVAGSKSMYPVTRERWGKAFDGIAGV